MLTWKMAIKILPVPILHVMSDLPVDLAPFTSQMTTIRIKPVKTSKRISQLGQKPAQQQVETEAEQCTTNLDVIFHTYNTAVHDARWHGRDLQQLCIPRRSAARRYRQTYTNQWNETRCFHELISSTKYSHYITMHSTHCSTCHTCGLDKKNINVIYSSCTVKKVTRWCNSKALDLWSVGRGFKSCSRQRCVTTLGKLFTPMCLCHQAV